MFKTSLMHLTALSEGRFAQVSGVVGPGAFAGTGAMNAALFDDAETSVRENAALLRAASLIAGTLRYVENTLSASPDAETLRTVIRRAACITY